MHRIDHPTADVTNPLVPVFTEGNPATGVPATVVTDDWLNDVQENIMAVIEAASVTPTKGDNGDLLDAINLLASAAIGLRSKQVFSYSGSQTLTNAVLGGTVLYTGSGGHNFTMPIINTPAGNCPAGTRIQIVNLGTGAVTPVRQSSDTFKYDNTTPTTVAAVPVGGGVTFESDGTSAWRLVDGLLKLQYGDHDGKTQAFGNDTTLLATTAFVQRALGNLRTASIVTTTQNLTAADMGRYYHLNQNSINLQLPNPNTVPLGSQVVVSIGTNTNHTISAAAGNIYQMQNNTTGSSFSPMNKSTYIFTAVSTTLWHCVAIGGASDTSSNGYTRLQNGLQIQWGTGPAASTGSTITFPIAFPSACRAVVAITNSTGNAVIVSSKSTSQFTWTCGASTQINWIALGY